MSKWKIANDVNIRDRTVYFFVVHRRLVL
jgi:hypothetical protein